MDESPAGQPPLENVNDQAVVAPAQQAPPPRRAFLVDLVSRRLYNHNPFYVLSAALVFWGLRLSFDRPLGPFPGWKLSLGLAGYTVLTAIAAVAIVRWARVKVWDDARSLLLIIVLELLALSVASDDALVLNPGRGAWLAAAGFVFSITVTELVLRGMRIGMPAGYRVPFHLALLLFFGYPLLVAQLAAAPTSAALEPALFAFSIAAALVALALIPAVRRGAAYVRANGTPWTWPLFPFSALVVMGLGVAARAYYLCLAYEFVGHDATIFAPYFLAPFLLAVSAVWLEATIASGRRRWQRVAVIAPLFVFLSATSKPADALAVDFAARFAATTGAQPMFWVLIMCVAFYAIAALRNVPLARECFAITAGLLSIVHREGTIGSGMLDPYGWPFWIVAVQQAWIGVRRRQWSPITVAACGCMVATTIELRGTWFTAYAGVLPLHLAIAALLIGGVLGRDGLSPWLRGIAIAALLLLGTATLAREPLVVHFWPHALVVAYPWLVSTVMIVWCAFAGHGVTLMFTTVYLWACIWVDGRRGYVWLRPRFAGLDQLAAGMALFALGLLISAVKAGWLRAVAKSPQTPLPDAPSD